MFFVKKKLFIFTSVISLFIAGCSSPSKDVHKKISKPSFIHNAPFNINYKENKIENFNNRNISQLQKKWKDKKQPIIIAHFGDSHIQTGWQVGATRRVLQSVRGNGGRGMIFPYSIAKTYSQEDYVSGFIGKWRTANSIQQPPKIGVGISGFVAVTEEPFSSVNFNFIKSPQNLGNVNATLYFRALDGDYQIIMSNGVISKTSTIHAGMDNNINQLSFDLPNTAKNINIQIRRISGIGKFEFHGLNLKNNSNGLIYHNLGVGGANFNAILHQRYFEQQFPMIHADLVVLDWGTNDLIYTNQIAPELENKIRQTIRRVKSVNPKAVILLKSVQEANYKGNNVTISATYAKLIRRIAKSENVLFYDWYNISGKSGSVNLWRSLGFASKDGIHLNGKGYRIEGELFGTALINMLNH
ncbi:hypothetical protein A4G19_04900 [Pasteurellaceae bacterium Macca]|nr:hypothetical protein [Pasteurellaceae bacterium Macca]